MVAGKLPLVQVVNQLIFWFLTWGLVSFFGVGSSSAPP